MDGEELIVQVRAKKMIFRKRELNAHQQRKQAGETKKNKCCDDVAAPDIFVIGVQSQPINPGARDPKRSSSARSSCSLGADGMWDWGELETFITANPFLFRRKTHQPSVPPLAERSHCELNPVKPSKMFPASCAETIQG